MAKKYLSLEEAAARLGVANDEVMRLRERGQLRGFADRGTWKFKDEDVEEFVRRRQADSDPDVPLMDEEEGSSLLLGDELRTSSGDDDDFSEQPTVIRGHALDDESFAPLDTSDSDVRLVMDESVTGDYGETQSPDESPGDSDSDVRLVDESTPMVDSGSDSDVKLINTDSDSDVRLAPIDQGSDSDVKLISTGRPDAGSRSDVSAIADDDDMFGGGESVLSDGDDDFTFSEDSGMTLKSDSGISLERLADSGISLEGDDSGIALETGDSGIALDPGESGIALAHDEDSGIALDLGGESGIAFAADSGISLDRPAESGIALDRGDEMNRTAPMLDAHDDDDFDQTHLEVPAFESDDSQYELASTGKSGSGDTSVILFDDDDAGEDNATLVKKKGRGPLEEMDSAEADVFDLGDAAETDAVEFEDDLEVTDDLIGEDDELEELDVFDAADEDFDESFEAGESHAEFVAPMGAARYEAPVEQNWGAGTFVGLLFSTALLGVCSMVMYDLVRSMWAWQEPTAFSSSLLSMLSDIF